MRLDVTDEHLVADGASLVRRPWIELDADDPDAALDEAVRAR